MSAGKLATILGILATLGGIAGAVYEQGGKSQHHEDQIDWCVKHVSWQEQQLAHVSKGQPIDWQSRPSP